MRNAETPIGFTHEFCFCLTFTIIWILFTSISKFIKPSSGYCVSTTNPITDNIWRMSAWSTMSMIVFALLIFIRCAVGSGQDVITLAIHWTWLVNRSAIELIGMHYPLDWDPGPIWIVIPGDLLALTDSVWIERRKVEHGSDNPSLTWVICLKEVLDCNFFIIHIAISILLQCCIQTLRN